MASNTRSGLVRIYSGIGPVVVRLCFGIFPKHCRRFLEGQWNNCRSVVEALSKDCRTSLEQQSNICRRNIEESCVCTHAMAPARSGLGLALGMMLLSVQMTWFLEAQGQMEDDNGTTLTEHHEYRLPTVTTEKLTSPHLLIAFSNPLTTVSSLRRRRMLRLSRPL